VLPAVVGLPPAPRAMPPASKHECEDGRRAAKGDPYRGGRDGIDPRRDSGEGLHRLIVRDPPAAQARRPVLESWPPMRSSEVTAAGSGRSSISSLSSAPMNPYLELLYRSLAEVGVPTGPGASLRLRWLLSHRTGVRYLHVHWPEPLYRFERGPSRLRPALSWLKLALLSARLRVAQALGYRILWTVHQVRPHGSSGRLDHAAARMLTRRADLLLAHDPETAGRVRQAFSGAEGIEVVTHGSYVGVYPPGRSRARVRQALGVDEDAIAFISFGELRANSGIGILLDAFAAARIGNAVLVVAGNTKDARVGAVVAAAAAADARIVRIDGFVPFEGVRELYEAVDVAVVPRSDGGTSGSLILALSLGKPVIAADMPAYRRLLADGAAGWLFAPGDAVGLTVVLEAAAADSGARAEKAAATGQAAAALDWSESARRLASLLPK
jgi:beta-1,4-mannosyltransferase